MESKKERKLSDASFHSATSQRILTDRKCSSEMLKNYVDFLENYSNENVSKKATLGKQYFKKLSNGLNELKLVSIKKEQTVVERWTIEKFLQSSSNTKNSVSMDSSRGLAASSREISLRAQFGEELDVFFIYF